MPTESVTENTARLALRLAEEARDRGTFGVGAVLVDDRSGEILDAIGNDVVRKTSPPASAGGRNPEADYQTHDPTAHGERQLISRYFERTHEGEDLAPPGELTIVSSLEPCAMCSGAILASKFKVGVIALDPVAGLGLAEGRSFDHLPNPIQDAARRSFGYFEIPGVRPFAGSTAILATETKGARMVSREVHDACEKTFGESLDRVMGVVSERGGGGPVEDPADLRSDDPLLSALREKLPGFLSIRLEDPRQPDHRLTELLVQLCDRNPGKGSSAALVDRFGNLLIARGTGSTDDPTATGFAETIRTYSKTRFELAGDSTLSGPAGRYLAHPKLGTLFRYPVPDPDSPLTLFELGVYGSTLEGSPPPGTPPILRFVTGSENGKPSRAKLESLVRGMPRFYTEIAGTEFEIV